MFRRVLIANRGEIAVRVARTLRDMGITSIAVYSDADRDALFVNEADEAYRLGPASPADSYLNVPAILDIARQSKADGIHPGYGFLAENGGFATAVEEAGLSFIGPSPHAIKVMGDKVEARSLAREVGVPTVPGSPGPVRSLTEAEEFAAEVGYPVVVKASGGGGGRGMRVVRSRGEMTGALESATREAEAYFKNPEVYIERYFDDPKHIEIQVMGDRTGRLVHLGERDCSIQRRHQKLVEEAPSPVVDPGLRERMGEMALRLAGAVEYSSAGTVEFLLARDRQFYFLEMNTRIQVEHPVTEQVSGVDLIREMILAAAGEELSVKESRRELDGHAIEIRINAEDPRHGFRPTPGPITSYIEPGGIGIRVDSGVYAGFVIPQSYDSLIAKVIGWGPDRETARRRVLRGLRGFRIGGPDTTIPFAQAVLGHQTFIDGTFGTAWLESNLGVLESEIRERGGQKGAPSGESVSQRGEEREFELEVNRKRFVVRVAERLQERQEPAQRTRSTQARGPAVSADAIVSPMHGTILAVNKEAGDSVEAGETVFVIEAMKMENEVTAPHSGTLGRIEANLGDTVEADQRLATYG